MSIQEPAADPVRRTRRRCTQVKDVMGHVAIAVPADASCADIVAALRRFKVGAVAVVDEDRRVLGVVSEDDLPATGRTAWELMTSPAIVVTRETPVREAAALMRDHRIRQLPVINPESGRIVGTLHRSDLLKALAERYDGEEAGTAADGAAGSTRPSTSARSAATTARPPRGPSAGAAEAPPGSGAGSGRSR